MFRRAQGQKLLFCPNVTLCKEKINSNPVLILHFNQMTSKAARADDPLKTSGVKVMQHKADIKVYIKLLTGSLF